MRRTRTPKFALANRQKTLRLDLPAVRRAVAEAVRLLRAAESERLTPEISIVFVDDTEIAELNEQFLGHKRPTDVITFKHGEIVVSTDRAVEQAKQFRSPTCQELALYLIHGLLHLAGYDDGKPVARRRMHRRQQAILCALAKKLDLEAILR